MTFAVPCAGIKRRRKEELGVPKYP